MADDRPVQHTPKHLQDDEQVFDRRHPAASPFAVAQPAAGVVANDADERGQNLAGGPKADDAAGEYADQKEVLAKQHEENLRTAAGVDSAPAPKIEDGAAKAADSKDTDRSSSARAAETASASPGERRSVTKPKD